MLTTIFFATILAASLFSAENLVTTIVGFIATMGITQWLKNQTGAAGLGAVFLAMGISIVVAVAAVAVSALFAGGISWETIPQAALQIFALATFAYRLIMAIGD